MKFFQKGTVLLNREQSPVPMMTVVSRSPPSIPHTEHPIAYKGQKLLRVRFLEPQDFKSHRGPSSVSAAIRRDQPAPSPIALGSPAMQGIPSTLASPSIVRGSVTIGSPSLPIGGSRIVKETPYPMYEFKLQQGEFLSSELGGGY